MSDINSLQKLKLKMLYVKQHIDTLVYVKLPAQEHQTIANLLAEEIKTLNDTDTVQEINRYSKSLDLLYYIVNDENEYWPKHKRPGYEEAKKIHEKMNQYHKNNPPDVADIIPDNWLVVFKKSRAIQDKWNAHMNSHESAEEFALVYDFENPLYRHPEQNQLEEFFKHSNPFSGPCPF